MINERNQSEGYLIVKVSTGNGALPVEGANVFIYENDKTGGASGVILSDTTRADGLTDKFTLPASPKEASLQPGNKNAYIGYNIEIVKDGYYTVRDVNAPIFAGITSIQPVTMIPVSEFSNGEDGDLTGRNTIEIKEGETL